MIEILKMIGARLRSCLITPQQMWRMINRDYPWLWHIRGRWDTAKQDIMVKRPLEINFWHGILAKSFLFLGPCEIWVHWIDGSAEGVTHVAAPDDYDKPVSHRVLELLPENCSIEHFVFILPEQPHKRWREEVVVIRDRREAPPMIKRLKEVVELGFL